MTSPMDIEASYMIEPQEQQGKKERRSRKSRPSVRMKPILRDETSVETNGQLQSQVEEDQNESTPGTRVFFVIKAIFGFIFYLLVLVCTVFSKLTLVSLTDKLREITFCNDTTYKNCPGKIEDAKEKVPIAVSLYWQLLLVMMVPTFIAFLRSLVFGVLGKTKQSYPWPKMKSAIVGVAASILEVGAISVFVFLVMAELPPGISLLLLSGVFFCQIAIDIVYTKKICCGLNRKPSEYYNLEDSLQDSQEKATLDSEQEAITVSSVQLGKLRKFLSVLKLLLENKIVKILALSLQFSSVVIFIALWCVNFMSYANTGLTDLYRTRPMIALPICLLVLSGIWTNKFQDWITKVNKNGAYDNRTARYKSSFINSTVRLVLYPFITYIIFRYATPYKIDPWCMVSSESPCLNFSGETLANFLVQIFTTLFAYLFAWIACTMTLSPYGMALPLLVATPLSAICYYVHMYGGLQNVLFFPDFGEQVITNFSHAYPWAPIIVGFLWVGQVLGIGFYVFTKRNIILSEDSNMFLTPSYDGVFFEQHMILNRQVKKTEASENEMTFMGNVILRNLRTIFICSTMYRENVVEMRQMLTSIQRVALNYEREKRINQKNCDSYESHIFFDGALNGTQLQDFGLQLLSLLEETLQVKPKDCTKKITPYGMCLQYQLNKVEPMPFYIHFKDKNLVKPKKRWSQVMYINYIINHRIQKDPKLTEKNTFILTTDADIDFTAKSAVVLLDMLETNPKIGAVCARTHPKGSGPLYWYQVFDYAIGHWFQKPAEHLLGCVLCSPGCFSVFRCSALQQVLETYSTLATNGMEFLMKDMGEDRWLCTLLIKKGWRLEYCAISEDQTYCPLEFGEFFGQRRRWIPSTIANLSLLISDTASITRTNDTVSVLFILFQAIMVFSTSISPATVILVIASGLQSAYGLSDPLVLFIIALLVFVSVLYGMVCLFASPKSQIDVAKVLSFIFAIIMLIVFVGIFKGVILNIFPNPDLTFLKSPNCSAITGQNITGEIAKCESLSRYLDSLPNTLLGGHFKLPISTSVIYFGIFAVTFVGAALLHPTEFTCLFHFIWYLLALPSGYLLLLIYSAANLDSQSWGTREGSSGKDKGLLGWGKYFMMAWNKLVSCCVRTRCCKPDQDVDDITTAKEAPKKEQEDSSSSHDHHSMADIEYVKISKEARKWLLKNGCSEDYIQMFSENGYTTEHYIAAMTLKDLEEIGIDRRGFRLRLAKAAKKLPGLPIHVDVPEDVGTWLRNLEMTEYTQLFRSEGYEVGEDIENLKGLTKKELQGMGITKRAHLQRLTKALHSLAYPKDVELQMYHTKGVIENVTDVPLSDDETQFWKDLIFKKLKPVSAQLTAIEEIKESLRSLRNTVLVVLFLVNIMWIIALYTVTFPRLADYDIDPRAFQLLFLFVYGFIIIVQFFMMICHRGITLVHYFGRVRPYHVAIPATGQLDFLNLSLRPSGVS